ncbi:Protein of unknown function [Cotesia congregata]|uniref:SOCS box domain-containing protein n=1 Tax=Cotesia congregata TaxID=51543 RepID=A0A8J2HAA4_COTCN|nr:Protein of unknown function [Cotesia congregata]
MVDELLARKVNLKATTTSVPPPLQFAVEGCRMTSVQKLLAAGADVNHYYGPDEDLPLVRAINNLRPDMIKLLIRHVTEPSEGWITTPLMSACHAKAPRSIEFLINLPNIDISKVNNKNETCLFMNVNGLDAAGLELILNTNIECRGILDKDAETGPIQAECFREVQLMMNTYEPSINWSFFRILRVSQHLLTLRFKNIQVPAGNEEELIENFPIYGRMLAFHMKKALQRKVLFEQAEEVLLVIFRKLLPATVINEIIFFLTNYDLYKLKE